MTATFKYALFMESSMQDQALITYLRQNLARGYTPEMLRNHLISHGYPARVVDQALHQASPIIVHHTHHVPASVILSIAVALMLIGLGGAGLYLFQAPKPSFLLDLETEPLASDAQPGSSFFFTTDLVSIGSARRFDVKVLHEILDMRGQAISSKEEEFGVETRASKKSSFLIPEAMQPGSYLLRTIATYPGGNATASFRFDVKRISEPAPQPEPQTQPSQRVEQEVPPETLPTEDPFAGLSISEKLDRIAESAATDPDQAGKYCEEIAQDFYKNQCYLNIAKAMRYERPCTRISDSRPKDQCFTEVAKLTGQSSLCDSVTFGDARDACLMAFVLRGDYSVCANLQNRYYIETCDALAAREE